MDWAEMDWAEMDSAPTGVEISILGCNFYTVYVRTDKREYFYNTTLEILKKQFPDYTIQILIGH